MFAAFARFAVRFRWFILVGGGIATPVVGSALPSLSSVTEFGTTAFLSPSAPSAQAGTMAGAFEGADPSSLPVFVAARASGRLTAADAAAIRRADHAVRSLPGVIAVHDAGTSPDGHAYEAAILTSPCPAGNSVRTLVQRMRAALRAAAPPAGLAFHLTGALAETADSGAVARSGAISALSMIFILVLLLVVFRAALAPLLVLIPAVACLSVSMSLIAEASKGGLSVSQVTQELLIVLVLGAGTDYGLFLAFRIREELALGAGRREAVEHALSRVGETITYSAVTVALALLSLSLSSFGVYRSLGPAMAIGIGVMLLASLTLTPALFAIVGPAAFWPRGPRPAAHRPGPWGRMAVRLIRRPVPALLAGFAIFGALAAGLAGFQTAGITSSPPRGSDSAAGAAVISAHFPGASAGADQALFSFAAPVWDNPAVLAAIGGRLDSSPVFRSVTGPTTALTGARLAKLHAELGSAGALPTHQPAGSPVPARLYQKYRATRQFISPDGRTVQFYVTMRAGPVGSVRAASAVPQARAVVTAAARQAGARAHGLAGQDATSYDVQAAANASLRRVVPVVLGLILVLLACLLRSLVAPWYLVATVGFSYLAALGFAMIVFVHLGHQAGLTFVLPFLMSVFTMALGEDYNILIMSRIREEARRQASFRDAFTHAMTISGGTITSAGIILAGTFVVLGVAGGNSQAQQLGFSIAFGVLLDTFFVRTLLVPAIVALLGRWNWWPSRLATDGAMPAAGALPASARQA